MKEAIEGPNCKDPNVCHGDCCSIKIDVPKVLAEEYIKNRWAEKGDFIRGDTFSFHLRFDDKTGKCFLFDKALNGCKVHDTGIKPPQCWIYPTNFSNPDDKEISCKRAAGWKIRDPIKAREAEKLLQIYVTDCEKEAKNELQNLNQRIKSKNLKNLIKNIAPSQLGGFKDTWEAIEPLSAEGFSLTMKRFCLKYHESCPIIREDYLACKNTCNKIATCLVNMVQNKLFDYIQMNGPDVDGEYPLYKFFNFVGLND